MASGGNKKSGSFLKNVLLVVVVILASIGGRMVGALIGSATAGKISNESGTVKPPSYESYEYEDSVYSETEYQQKSYGYIDGYWGEKFTTNRGYTHPFEFNSPLTCRRFYLDYRLTDVTEGTLYGDPMFKVFVRTTKGEWIGTTLFKLTSDEVTVEVDMEKERTIEAVAVMCQQDGVGFSYSFDVYNPS